MYEIKRTKANRVTFERVAFVCKAVTVDRERPYASVVHVERARAGSRLVATDGKTRLHVAAVSIRIPAGNYRPSVSKDTVVFEPSPDIRFPDWSKSVPKNAVKSAEVNLEKTAKGNVVEKAAAMSLAVNTLNVKTGAVVNTRHIAELPKTTWTVYKEPGYGKLVVRQRGDEDSAFAVLIPVGKAA
jgi:translation elongation factor EF-G